MAFSFRSVFHNIADNGNTTATGGITPIPAYHGGAFAGDLVVIITSVRGTNGNFSISGSSQTWNSLPNQQGSPTTLQYHWCKFNGQAETGQLNCANTNALPHCVTVMIFGPTQSEATFALETQSSATYASDANIAIPGITSTKNSTVVIAAWASQDDNTWGNLAGAGWTKAGLPDQLRNIGGSDLSQTWAYQVRTAPGDTGSVSQDQLTLGGDAGVTYIASFEEVVTAPGLPRRILFIN